MSRLCSLIAIALFTWFTVGCSGSADTTVSHQEALGVSQPVLLQDLDYSRGAGQNRIAPVLAPDSLQTELLRHAVDEFQQANLMDVRLFKDSNGRMVDEITISGRPPVGFRMSAAALSSNTVTASMTEVPAFDWCYGCSATSAAMMAGYYDRTGYTYMYSGPTNSGVMPLNNASWGEGECPLSATNSGIDGRTARGHVDDYWVETESTTQDPYITGGWTRHDDADCTADFMGTNQSRLTNIDGSTRFYYYTDGSPTYDYVPAEETKRDGGHGLRVFFESRGYTVLENFNQYILGHNGNTLGFTLDQFKAEIDAGRPVLIHVTNHTMLGYGYQEGTSTINIHDTWDHANHTMTWGSTYGGLQHYAVSVFKLGPECQCDTVSPCCDGCRFVAGSCDADGNGCTVNDQCSAGACVAGPAPDCSAATDQCNVGQCVSTGQTTYTCEADPTTKDGVACNADSNGCTKDDICSAGACVAGPAFVCPEVADQCRVRACKSTGNNTRTCIWDPVPKEGDACNADSSGCTVDDICQSGTCTPGLMPDCSGSDDQCNVGQCASSGNNSYVCVKNPTPLNGSGCNADSSGCTVDDRCETGTCVPGSAPDCSSVADDCHSGVCHSTGTVSFECLPENLPDGTFCNADSNGCTAQDRCTAGTCEPGAVVDCSSADDQCNTGYCSSTGSTTFECLKNPAPHEGASCEADNNGCTVNDTCGSGQCLPGPAPDCTALDDTCNVGACMTTGNTSFTCFKDPAPLEGVRCNADSDGCTVKDMCMSGECMAGDLPDCSSVDDQCNAGMCSSTGNHTFVCVKNPSPLNNRPCDADNNGCTVDDTCGNGVCIAGPVNYCPDVGDECNIGVCHSTGPRTFECLTDSEPRDGTSCDADGDGCTQFDTCLEGACRPGEAADCSPLDGQCGVGTCISTGTDQFECVLDWAAWQGALCNADNDGCTAGDVCQSGVCEAGTQQDCLGAADRCNTAFCQSTGPDSHECVMDPTMHEGLPCDADSDGCTRDDSCVAGVCVTGEPVDCREQDDSCNTGYCQATGAMTWECRKDPAPHEGAPCNADDDGCTVDDTCVAGECSPGRDSGCGANNTQCLLWSCISKGTNSFECVMDTTSREGTICDADGNGCTRIDTCVLGGCLPGSLPDCSGQDDDCNVGTCESTGPFAFKCGRDPTAREGSLCNADSNGCTVDDECELGRCVAGATADCTEFANQCTVSQCLSTGQNAHECVIDTDSLDGQRCDADSDGCTIDDICVDGDCQVGTRPDCSSQSDQCNAGACLTTGANSFECVQAPLVMDGAGCDADDDGCTVDDTCVMGECMAGPAPDCTGLDDQCVRGRCVSHGGNEMECLPDPTALEGTGCDADGDGCTVGDSCLDGTCMAGNEADCSVFDDQCGQGLCVATGTDSHECVRDHASFEGKVCDADGNGCTVDDTCVSGTCVTGAAADCSIASDQCNTGYCRSAGPLTMECLKDPTAHHGKRCNADNSGCTINDTCSSGRCVTGGRADCSGLNDQCNTGKCRSTDVNAWECVKDPAPAEGNACNADNDGCTVGDACASGTCLPGASPDCSAVADVCVAARCASTGAATWDCLPDDAAMDGIDCEDGLTCSINDKCASGECVGAARQCDDGIDCTTDSCDETSGGCRFVENDSACDDGNPCTIERCDDTSGCLASNLDDWSFCVDPTHACFDGLCDVLKPNDTCPGAHEIDLDVEQRVEAAGYHAYLPVPDACVTDGVSGPDAFYRLSTTAGAEYVIEVTPDPDVSMAVVVKSGCATSAACIAGDTIDGSADHDQGTVHIPSSDEDGAVFIQIVFLGDSVDAGGCAFTVRLIEAPGDHSDTPDVIEPNEDVVIVEVQTDTVETDTADVSPDTGVPDTWHLDVTDAELNGAEFVTLPDEGNQETDIGTETVSGCSASDSPDGRAALPLLLLAFSLGCLMLFRAAARGARSRP
ncbi:MAG TPA: hypothetical protein PLY68_04170 [Myxococcota bacterium]|nr:hypothetical protein [Myxococcota bacterium]HPB50890.1 hypothetical protein [Myxococcota bacterium]HQP95374.1 hypothetical protein [Myxococcota bacterium]